MAAVARGQPRALHYPGRGLLFLALAAIAVALLGMALAMAWPEGSHKPTKPLNLGAPDDYAIGSVTFVPERRLYLVRLTSDEFVALSWRNPGAQHCTVPWNKAFRWPDSSGIVVRGWFRDPCSGATFDRAGHRVFGPSPRDMDRFPVSIVAGHVLVTTSQYVCGFSPPYVTNCAPPTGSP